MLDFYLAAVAASPRLLISGYGVGIDDLAWLTLVGAALRKGRPSMALALPMAVVLFVAALSILLRSVPEPWAGLLTLAKLAQLFGAYAAARALGVDAAAMTRAAVRAVLLLALIGGVELLVRDEAAAELRHTPFRLFDNAFYPGQTNHVAGFIALVMPLVLREPVRILRWAAATLGTAVVLLTASKAGIVALAAGLIVSFPRPLLIAALAAGVLLVPTARRRLALVGDEWTYFRREMERREAGQPPAYTEGRFRLMVAWIALDEVRKAPVLGTGLGSRHRIFYESAWVMVPAETGLVGLAAALALGAALVKRPVRDPPVWRGVLVAFVLLGFGAVSIVITRMAAPFWLAAAALEER